jgi:hypothetical protein
VGENVPSATFVAISSTVVYLAPNPETRVANSGINRLMKGTAGAPWDDES